MIAAIRRLLRRFRRRSYSDVVSSMNPVAYWKLDELDRTWPPSDGEWHDLQTDSEGRRWVDGERVADASASLATPPSAPLEET